MNIVFWLANGEQKRTIHQVVPVLGLLLHLQRLLPFARDWMQLSRRTVVARVQLGRIKNDLVSCSRFLSKLLHSFASYLVLTRKKTQTVA